LKEALVLQKQKFGLVLLPEISAPFLIPIAEKYLKDFATFFYAEDKAKGLNSNPKYVASSARNLNVVLEADTMFKRARFLRLYVRISPRIRENFVLTSHKVMS